MFRPLECQAGTCARGTEFKIRICGRREPQRGGREYRSKTCVRIVTFVEPCCVLICHFVQTSCLQMKKPILSVCVSVGLHMRFPGPRFYRHPACLLDEGKLLEFSNREKAFENFDWGSIECFNGFLFLLT